jgi:hypothetical protein
MPGFDRTGPLGGGPRTGGGFGYCGPYAGAESYRGIGFGGNFGRGRRYRRYSGRGFGRGRGTRFWGTSDVPGFYPQVSPNEESNYLRDQIAQLKADLHAMEDRLAVLNEDRAGETGD